MTTRGHDRFGADNPNMERAALVITFARIGVGLLIALPLLLKGL